MAKSKKKRLSKGPSFHKHTPSCYTADLDGWVLFTDRQRGIYGTLIIYLGLAENNGKLKLNLAVFEKISNYSGDNFKSDWDAIKHKFIEKDGYIYHSKVTEELKKARKLIKQRRLAGQASGAKRRREINERSTNDNTNDEQSKRTKANNNVKKLELMKAGIEFDRKLKAVFGDLTPREDRTFSKIRFYLINLNNIDAFNKAILYLSEVKEWANRHNKDNVEAKKCFVSKVKKNLNWKP